MDYPNSKKARKVFLCLYVGGGGGGQQQVPKGLEGDEEVDGSRAKFETRRERVSKSSKKRKEIKGKEWILRKKEVCYFYGCSWALTTDNPPIVVPSTRKGERSTGLQIHW